jgi:hypothetical protein
MRKLVALFALSLTTSVAWAQTDKAPAVTKLPGEERLSTRERAERDFLMPVRRKKAAELSKLTASAEQLATASPETDELAHYSEAADVRAEEVATAATHVAATHSRSSRRAAWLAARYARASSVSAARRTSKSSKATKASRTKAAKRSTKATHATKASRSKKATSRKAASHKAKKVVATKAKHHTATKKVTTKAKPAAKHKRRR